MLHKIAHILVVYYYYAYSIILTRQIYNCNFCSHIHDFTVLSVGKTSLW